MVKKAIERKRDCEGAYYLLCRALFAAGRYQEVVDVSEAAIEASGEDYNVYVPIMNALGAMGKEEAKRNMSRAQRRRAREPLEAGARRCSGAHVCWAPTMPTVGREEDALRELNLAVTLRANEASILYNAACVYCLSRERPKLSMLCARPGKRVPRRRLGAPRPGSCHPSRRARVRTPVPGKRRCVPALRPPLANTISADKTTITSPVRDERTWWEARVEQHGAP